MSARPGFNPMREIMMILRGGSPSHLHLRQRLVWLVGSLVVADLVCSWIAFAVEKDAPGSALHSYGDSLFWSTTQLLTVSSSLPNPVTGAGMWLDVVMELVGITVVATLAGSLGSFLLHRSFERVRSQHPLPPGVSVEVHLPEPPAS